MNTIKLPKNAIEFFKSNQDKIFDSGKLAEGPWNEELSKKKFFDTLQKKGRYTTTIYLEAVFESIIF